jgi:PAS domain S-box-containing protein
MIILKLKSHSNYYKKLYQRWREINESQTLIEIANLALDMMVDDLGYECAVIFIHEDDTGLFKPMSYRGYDDPIDLQPLRIVQALLSGEAVEAMRRSSEPIVHTEKNISVPAIGSLLKQIRLQEAVLSVFGGDSDVPFGFVVVGNRGSAVVNQSVEDENTLVALNNLFVHLSHAVNSVMFYKAWTQEKEHLRLNIDLRTQEILVQKQQFEAIFQNSIDGIAILDVHTTAFLNANPAFLELTGYSRAELLRISCLALTSPESISLSEQAFERVLQCGYVSDFMKNCVVANGRRITVNMSMVLMHDKQQILVSAKDMTQRYKLERELLEAKDKSDAAQVKLAQQNKMLEDLTTTLENKVVKRTRELEQALVRAKEAADAKSQFLATMSHEIRTPMNGVLGMTELLANTQLNEEQKQLLHVLQSSGRTLLTLIDDILDFSKIEVGKLELECIPIDFHSFLTDLKKTFTVQAQARGLDLILVPVDDLPHVIKGDPTRLRQVFSNLIANAIKFTHQGSVVIGVKRSADDEFEVSVKDSGIGVSEEVQQRLFTAFTQANSSITRQYGGSGLGLVISAMLVKLMGGRIWMESVVGIGSIFRFTFKAISIKSTLTPASVLSLPAQDMGHLNVLLAEDHQINQLLVRKILNQVNISPDLACDGLEVLACIKNKHYDIILMDLQMPNMDGLTATRHIRADKQIRQPYIIALTANAFAEDKEQCYLAGMNDFISKPISIDGLVSALNRAKSGQLDAALLGVGSNVVAGQVTRMS